MKIFSRGILSCTALLTFHVEAFSVVSTVASSRRILLSRATATPTPAASSLHATVATDDVEARECGFVKSAVLNAWNSKSANEYAEMFGFTKSEAGFYGLVEAIRTAQIAMGLKGVPFVLRRSEIEAIVGDGDGGGDENVLFQGFYTMKDLEKALEDDFLDAARGSTDNRKGWRITTVSNPRGDSFEEARMTYDDVLAALEKGTVIFNAAGAHIPKLAGPCMAVTDAASTPNALNLYVTAAGKRTSAPPHTDKQDVIVVQSQGRKFWRVYKPLDPSLKPMADLFARGKGDDDLPLYTLQETGELLVETTLEAGDVLFVPGGFPHTTGTALDASENDDTSLHLTFNIDTHVWDLDYLSVRRLALRRACVPDTALGQSRDEDNRYVGKVNELPRKIHEDMFEMIPLGFLDEEPPEEASVDAVTAELIRISQAVDPETAGKVEESVWKETVEQMREHGMSLLEIHRDMYLAAIEEGRTREAEDAMTAHLNTPGKRKTMSPERMQRLSLFRVQRYYEQINSTKDKLVQWSYAGQPGAESSGSAIALPENWAFTMPVKVGDQVEANLGGAFFPALVTKFSGNAYDVKFFDGDQESGLERSMLKLMKPPNLAGEEVDTSNMTPKQLKRWKKEQEKKIK